MHLAAQTPSILVSIKNPDAIGLNLVDGLTAITIEIKQHYPDYLISCNFNPELGADFEIQAHNAQFRNEPFCFLENGELFFYKLSENISTLINNLKSLPAAQSIPDDMSNTDIIQEVQKGIVRHDATLEAQKSKTSFNNILETKNHNGIGYDFSGYVFNVNYADEVNIYLSTPKNNIAAIFKSNISTTVFLVWLSAISDLSKKAFGFGEKYFHANNREDVILSTTDDDLLDIQENVDLLDSCEHLISTNNAIIQARESIYILFKEAFISGMETAYFKLSISKL